MAWLY
jgi:hypothetical protein